MALEDRLDRLEALVGQAEASHVIDGDTGEQRDEALERTDKVSAQEFAQAVQEMTEDVGAEEAGMAIAEIVYRRITEEAPAQDLTGLLMPYDGMYQFGDGPVFTREGTPMLYWMGDESGDISLKRTKVVEDQFSMTFDSLYVLFEYNFDLLKSGKFGNFQRQISKAKNQFVAAANMLMWKALLDGKSADASGDLTVTALKTGIDAVEDNSQTGGKAIIGRKTALSKLSNFLSSATYGIGAAIPDNIKSEAWNKMHITNLGGYPMLGVSKQTFNGSRTKIIEAGFMGMEVMDNSNVIINSNDDYAFFAEQGPIAVMQSQDAATRNVSYSWGRRMGVVILDTDAYYRYTIT